MDEVGGQVKADLLHVAYAIDTDQLLRYAQLLVFLLFDEGLRGLFCCFVALLIIQAIQVLIFDFV